MTICRIRSKPIPRYQSARVAGGFDGSGGFVLAQRVPGWNDSAVRVPGVTPEERARGLVRSFADLLLLQNPNAELGTKRVHSEDSTMSGWLRVTAACEFSARKSSSRWMQ